MRLEIKNLRPPARSFSTDESEIKAKKSIESLSLFFQTEVYTPPSDFVLLPRVLAHRTRPFKGDKRRAQAIVCHVHASGPWQRHRLSKALPSKDLPFFLFPLPTGISVPPYVDQRRASLAALGQKAVPLPLSPKHAPTRAPYHARKIPMRNRKEEEKEQTEEEEEFPCVLGAFLKTATVEERDETGRNRTVLAGLTRLSS